MAPSRASQPASTVRLTTVEGRRRHVGLDIGRRAGRVLAPARELLVGRSDHDRHVVEELAVPEERRRDLALPAPVRALRRQDAFTELRSRARAARAAALGKCSYSLRNIASISAGRRHPGDVPAGIACRDDRLLEYLAWAAR